MRVGRAWGFRQTYYDYLEHRSTPETFAPFDLSTPELHRLPVYSQLDMGIAYSREVGRAGLQFRLLLLNLTDRNNVIDWALQRDPVTGELSKRNRSAVPFFPSLSARVSL
jgi:hypothetical protein